MNKYDVTSWAFLILALILLFTGNAYMSFFAMIFSELQQTNSKLFNMKNKEIDKDE